MSRWGRITAIALLVLAGCGDGGSGVSAPAGRVLDDQVDALRATASRKDRATAVQQLTPLRASVDQLESDGDVSETAADRIRRAADAVESQLALLPAPTTTTTTTTTTLPAIADDPRDDDRGNGNDRRDNDEDRDHGRGNGRGNDD